MTECETGGVFAAEMWRMHFARMSITPTYHPLPGSYFVIPADAGIQGRSPGIRTHYSLPGTHQNLKTPTTGAALDSRLFYRGLGARELKAATMILQEESIDALASGPA